MSESRCRNFAIISIVCAGVSLVIGGALLDIVGFIFGIIAFTNIKKALAVKPDDAYVQNAFKLAKIGLVLCCVACIANMLTAAFLMPALMEGMAPTGGVTF